MEKTRSFTVEEKMETLRRSEFSNYETDKYGNILGQRKERKKITNFTPPKKKRKNK